MQEAHLTESTDVVGSEGGKRYYIQIKIKIEQVYKVNISKIGVLRIFSFTW